MKFSRHSHADYLPFDLNLALADPSNPCQGGLESQVPTNAKSAFVQTLMNAHKFGAASYQARRGANYMSEFDVTKE